MVGQKNPKKKIISKDSKIFLILIIFFGVILLIQQNLYYNTIKNDIITISIQDSINQTDHKSKIFIPHHSSEQQLPAVILLNGDLISSRSLNLLKNEFLRNNFAVILAEISNYNISVTFTILAGILNETENQESIDSSRIGIMGHSRGAHYALHFAAIFERISIWARNWMNIK